VYAVFTLDMYKISVDIEETPKNLVSTIIISYLTQVLLGDPTLLILLQYNETKEKAADNPGYTDSHVEQNERHVIAVPSFTFTNLICVFDGLFGLCIGIGKDQRKYSN